MFLKKEILFELQNGCCAIFEKKIHLPSPRGDMCLAFLISFGFVWRRLRCCGRHFHMDNRGFVEV